MSVSCHSSKTKHSSATASQGKSDEIERGNWFFALHYVSIIFQILNLGHPRKSSLLSLSSSLSGMHSEARLCEGIPEKPFPIDGPGGVVKPMEPGLRWIFAIKGQLSCNDPCWLGVEGGEFRAGVRILPGQALGKRFDRLWCEGFRKMRQNVDAGI